MQRAALIPVLAVAIALAASPSAEAAAYFAHRDGLRVVFRVKGHRLIWASVLARLYCKGPQGRRHLYRTNELYAAPTFPLPIDRRRVFRYDTRGTRQEEGYSVEELLIGRAGDAAVTGRFEFSEVKSYGHRYVSCRTGSYPGSGGGISVTFRAERQPQPTVVSQPRNSRARSPTSPGSSSAMKWPQPSTFSTSIASAWFSTPARIS
jgi:hypothetical protein